MKKEKKKFLRVENFVCRKWGAKLKVHRDQWRMIESMTNRNE